MQKHSEKQIPSEADLKEAKKKLAGATVSKMVASAIGDMVTLYSKDSAHKHFAFADMDWKILPPIVSGQYHIETADDPEYGTLRPVALVTWAKVSDELDERLSAQTNRQVVRLRPSDWNSGEHYWLVDVVVTSDGVIKALKLLHNNQLNETNAKLLVHEKNGKKIRTLFDFFKKFDRIKEAK